MSGKPNVLIANGSGERGRRPTPAAVRPSVAAWPSRHRGSSPGRWRNGRGGDCRNPERTKGRGPGDRSRPTVGLNNAKVLAAGVATHALGGAWQSVLFVVLGLGQLGVGDGGRPACRRSRRVGL